MRPDSIVRHAPVLALHCSLASGLQWRSLAKAMPEREVVALDLLGYGDAPDPGRLDGFTLDDEVDALECQLARRLDSHEPLHLVGHSYGGAVAWRFALRHRNRVVSIALFEPVTLWLIRHRADAEPFRALANQATSEVDRGLMLQAAQRFIDFWSGAGTFASLPAERQSALAQGMTKVKLDFPACLSERGTLPAAGDFAMPALLMNGREALHPMKVNMRILRSFFADCVTAEVAGGHMAPVENRAEVDPLIARFIERCEARTAMPARPGMARRSGSPMGRPAALQG